MLTLAAAAGEIVYKATWAFLVCVIAPGATTLTVADAVLVGSDLLVAVTVTVVLSPVGAAKLPFASMVPAPLSPPPASVQVTPAGSPEAVNCVACPMPTAALVG